MKKNVEKFNYINLVIITFLSFITNFRLLSQNPITGADNFNILTEGNLSITAGDIEGAIGVGGNLTVLGNSQRTSANATSGQAYVLIGGVKYAMIVGGGLIGSNGGNIFKVDGKSGATDDHFIKFNTISPSTAATNSGGIDIGSPVTNNLNRYIRVNSTTQTASNVVSSSQIFDFSSNFATFKSNSTRMSGCTGNVTPSVSGGQATLNLGANTNNVWNVTGATLNSYNQINLTGNLPSANRTLIINVNNAGTFNWSNLKFVMGSESDNYMEVNRAPYIIWNFHNTTTLNIQNSNLILGTILAPLADLKNNGSGNITGQIIVKSFTKPYAGELHIAKFNGNLICGISPASLGDFVWEDNNANGIQESGELGIGGVVVTLSNGTSTTTNSNGFYSFTGLTPGTYTVTFATPTGYLASPTGAGTASNDSNGPTATVSLASGENNLTIDAGFYKLASIGDRVWLDENKSGIQDETDTNMEGVVVTLYNENGTAVTKDGLGATVAPITTASDGRYLFANLKPGIYQVHFSLASGYQRVAPDQSQDINNRTSPPMAGDEVDSDASSIDGFTGFYTLNAGDINLTADAGFQKSVALPIKIISFNASAKKNTIDLVWNTTNAENFSHFEIQKGLNAKEFGYIGTVNAKNAKTYSFTDFNPELNSNYYRLKSVDLDGSISYSKVVSVAFDSENPYTTVQNPAVNGTILLETSLKNPIITLSSAIGANVNIKVVNETSSRYLINVPNYTSGIYYLSISSEGKSITKKVLIP